ncbi:MAG: hypothetical protein M1826_007654 [Phylliscum demangeonii]|nr:MAG: hypothetical protein M1826_007654 [Phylliscum demangeonii]
MPPPMTDYASWPSLDLANPPSLSVLPTPPPSPSAPHADWTAYPVLDEPQDQATLYVLASSEKMVDENGKDAGRHQHLMAARANAAAAALNGMPYGPEPPSPLLPALYTRTHPRRQSYRVSVDSAADQSVSTGSPYFDYSPTFSPRQSGLAPRPPSFPYNYDKSAVATATAAAATAAGAGGDATTYGRRPSRPGADGKTGARPMSWRKSDGSGVTREKSKSFSARARAFSVKFEDEVRGLASPAPVPDPDPDPLPPREKNAVRREPAPSVGGAGLSTTAGAAAAKEARKERGGVPTRHGSGSVPRSATVAVAVAPSPRRAFSSGPHDPSRPAGALARNSTSASARGPSYHRMSRSMSVATTTTTTTTTTTSPMAPREWAPDRSPLQKLELTLQGISKGEKRALVEEAELLAREASVARASRLLSAGIAEQLLGGGGGGGPGGRASRSSASSARPNHATAHQDEERMFIDPEAIGLGLGLGRSLSDAQKQKLLLRSATVQSRRRARHAAAAAAPAAENSEEDDGGLPSGADDDHAPRRTRSGRAGPTADPHQVPRRVHSQREARPRAMSDAALSPAPVASAPGRGSARRRVTADEAEDEDDQHPTVLLPFQRQRSTPPHGLSRPATRRARSSGHEPRSQSIRHAPEEEDEAEDEEDYDDDYSDDGPAPRSNRRHPPRRGKTFAALTGERAPQNRYMLNSPRRRPHHDEDDDEEDDDDDYDEDGSARSSHGTAASSAAAAPAAGTRHAVVGLGVLGAAPPNDADADADGDREGGGAGDGYGDGYGDGDGVSSPSRSRRLASLLLLRRPRRWWARKRYI